VTPTLRQAIEEAVAETTGREVRIVGERPVGGGCIHDARIVELSDGGRLFVKSNRSAPADMFEREAEGLRALAEPYERGALRVPADPIAGESPDGSRFLILEAIGTSSPGRQFFEDFGRRFARLHRETIRKDDRRFGFEHDNYLGSTPQPNGRMASWVGFFRERRLGHQLRLARSKGLSDSDLDLLGDRLLDRLDEWIDLPDEPACLLHGDLWGGNFLASDTGEPVLVDPAVYHGHREADLAMTRLFGGFDRAFYAAYEEEWPLPPGSPERIEIYKLYHLLNHLNLFGRGYRGQCLAILRGFVG
jgi:protein-ribulosamine 3-kinase